MLNDWTPTAAVHLHCSRFRPLPFLPPFWYSQYSLLLLLYLLSSRSFAYALTAHATTRSSDCNSMTRARTLFSSTLPLVYFAPHLIPIPHVPRSYYISPVLFLYNLYSTIWFICFFYFEFVICFFKCQELPLYNLKQLGFNLSFVIWSYSLFKCKWITRLLMCWSMYQFVCSPSRQRTNEIVDPLTG